MEKFLIDVILADNSRPACGGPLLIRYSAGGVVAALSKKGFNVRCVDLGYKKKQLTEAVKQFYKNSKQRPFPKP
mgnify:CR=1 FL=1